MRSHNTVSSTLFSYSSTLEFSKDREAEETEVLVVLKLKFPSNI